ncbi:hypothetical protein Ae201684P_003481 [Aphanomyces euteiches]|uniref:Uncharacterized protein n=1 Tax=Aphanomyces euteiches TaxID=100861 RepID=A0A6G0W611_9STRA|nr:hypothetical protein Ae201684_018394 [Aphanomyces euteiches]KAH9064694.1 hypothetical protein Ae201684P_003481 [Aphanomyces euteiches]
MGVLYMNNENVPPTTRSAIMPNRRLSSNLSLVRSHENDCSTRLPFGLEQRVGTSSVEQQSSPHTLYWVRPPCINLSHYVNFLASDPSKGHPQTSF